MSTQHRQGRQLIAAQTCAKICLTLNANYGLARTQSIQKKVFHDISSIWIYIYILYIYELYACIYRNKLLWYSFINILIYCNLVQMLSHVDAFWHLCVWFGMGSNDSRWGNDYVRAKIAEAWNLTQWYDPNALTGAFACVHLWLKIRDCIGLLSDSLILGMSVSIDF